MSLDLVFKEFIGDISVSGFSGEIEQKLRMNRLWVIELRNAQLRTMKKKLTG